MRGHSTQRGRPEFAGGQREAILKMLRTAGPQGVSKEILLFEKHWSQAAARIFELEQQGFRIKHVQREGEQYVRYVLEGEPEHLKPIPTYQPKGPDKRQSTFANSQDWYTRQTKRERPGEPTSDLGPLFDGTVRP